MSPFLTKPLRTQAQAIADILAKMPPTYLIVDMHKGQPYFHEAEIGQSLGAVVYDLATGQHDSRNSGAPVAVLCISGDAKPENVTEQVAELVLGYLIERPHLLYGDGGYLKQNGFLDNAMREWERRLPLGPGTIDPPEYDKDVA